MKRSGIITLTTDFGEQDGFVGVMKGVILGINPKAKIVDITHSIERHNVDSAAFIIKNSFPFFPEWTVHTIVVDPGVGSARRIIILNFMEHIFLAPDNGVLEYVFSETEKYCVYNVINKDYFLKNISTTFHGRDIFAPVSAYISLGVDLNRFGPEINDYFKGESFEPITNKNGISGNVIYCDKFGNVITNIKGEDLLEHCQDKDIFINFKGLTIKGLSNFYSEGGKEKPIALIGSSGYVEIALYLESAAKNLGVKIGDSVDISF